MVVVVGCALVLFFFSLPACLKMTWNLSPMEHVVFHRGIVGTKVFGVNFGRGL